jgi:hypothetical protein
MIWPFRRRRPSPPPRPLDLSGYGGWWVAVDNGAVIGSARTPGELVDWAQAAGLRRATMFYVKADQP